MKRWGIGILIVFFIGIMSYKWPTSIDKQLLGIKYQVGSMNRDLAEPVKIWIVGTYYCSNRYLGESVEHYWVYGSISAAKDFSNFAITVLTPNDMDGKITEASWHSEDGIVIAAPAINRDQAIKVTRNFFYVEK